MHHVPMISSNLTTFCSILCFAGASIYLAIEDWKTQNLSVGALLILALGFVGMYKGVDWGNTLWLSSMTTITVYGLSWCVTKLKDTQALGQGDLILLFILTVGLSLDQIPWFIALSGLIALAYGFLGVGVLEKKPERIPFAPALLISRWFLLFFA